MQKNQHGLRKLLSLVRSTQDYENKTQGDQQHKDSQICGAKECFISTENPTNEIWAAKANDSVCSRSPFRTSPNWRRQRRTPGKNLPLLDWNKFNTDGKESHCIQINHNKCQLSYNKIITEETKRKADFDFMLEVVSLIFRTASDPEFTRENRETTIDRYKLSMRWRLVIMDDRIVVQVYLRRRLLDILHSVCQYNRDEGWSEILLVAGDQQKHRKQSRTASHALQWVNV